MKTQLRLLVVFTTALLCSMTSSYAQTTLVAGDIGVLWNQADTPDDFAFVTYVDLAEGTGIYFTDCGTTTFADGFRMPACTEGAVKYTVPAGGLQTGEIIKYFGNPNFVAYTDSRITGGLGLATSGDQIVVFQDATSAAGGTNAANNPTYIFVIHNASTQFLGDPTDSNETSVPFGLTDIGLPRTALGVGAGPGVDVEFDNTVYSGTYTFSTAEDAKIALTNPANYYGSNVIVGDPTYDALVAAIPIKLSLTTLSTEGFDFNTLISVFPNPSNGNVTIKNSGIALNSAIVTDMNGRVVASIDLEGTTVDRELNLSSVLSSGMYFMSISSDDASTVKKIMIK